MPIHSTIFALSSGRPPVAVAVIRISGPRAGAALTALGVKIPEPREARLARIRDPRSGEIIDEALVLWFPGPNSETGEDVAELQVHGGRAVIAAVLEALAGVEGLRMAEAGEFTRRGFENGKLDLTAVEGLADLVSAETETQRRQAFRQMKGLLGNRAEAWRKTLIQALALVEARIDFSDEADVPEDLVSPALAIARGLRDEIAGVLADGRRGERLREGLVVAIAGPPNAGKSTLLNRIAKREAAIVSPHAGTTRDVIEVHLDFGGLPVTLLDTAGIRETADPVEMEGVRRARERAASADLVLWVVDAGVSADGSLADPAMRSGRGKATSIGRSAAAARPMAEAAPGQSDFTAGNPANDRGGPSGHSLRDAVGQRFGSNAGVLPPFAVLGDPALPSGPVDAPASPLWRILNKIDLIYQYDNRSESEVSINKRLKDINNKGLINKNESRFYNYENTFTLSAASGAGFDALLAALERYAGSHLAGAEQSLVTRARHRVALGETLAALDRALHSDLAGQEDLLAEELRSAAASLGRLTGRVDVEDILDVIFRDFCIGK